MSFSLAIRLFRSSSRRSYYMEALRKSSSYCGSFSYDNQKAWPGICVRGNENLQSPINIVTKDVQADSSLSKLKLNSKWWEKCSGTLKNTTSSVQFVPSEVGEATIEHHRGVYQLEQFHFHWGPANGAGSEHTVDSSQADAELHFVHTKKGTSNENQRDFLTVIGVLLDASEESVAVTSPWAKMDITAIQPINSKPVSVSELVLGQLLPPANQSYYHYQGSLTTPPCSETVQWFLMKERISIPASFLQQLRMIQTATGQPLQSNFRALQSLGTRVVLAPKDF